jgi:hypothetical protein
MTEAEALQEAKRRWGKQGYVRGEMGAVSSRFSVGICEGVLFFVKGYGGNWEEAFAGADRNAKKLA